MELKQSAITYIIDMTDQQIADYIKKQREKGVAEEVIKERLVKKIKKDITAGIVAGTKEFEDFINANK
jgi:Rod binding domain-containing protein